VTETRTIYIAEPALGREFDDVEAARAHAAAMRAKNPSARTRVRLRPSGRYSVLVKLPVQQKEKKS
jgi:hypothetical protein